MSLVTLPGDGLWLPKPLGGIVGTQVPSALDTLLLDADEEEAQMIGYVRIDGGGSKTFGTSGSSVGWMTGASMAFAANSTVRVGVKKASSIDTANGPPPRATIGAAAFDVYDDLVGGVDTLSNTTWRTDVMTAGTPFTVSHGDLIAICWHLDTTAGTPSVKPRVIAATAPLFPGLTLVTSGPTYTAIAGLPNAILTFDDGTIGWLETSYVFVSAPASSGTIGNTNIFGNVFQVPFPCQIDALGAVVNVSAGGADVALDLYTTPLGTPALVEGLTHDANLTTATAAFRLVLRLLATPYTLAASTDYCVGVRQTTATAASVAQYSVNATSHWKAWGPGAECYAANSTAGATFAQQASGTRRYGCFVRISQLDNGVGGGGGGAVFGSVGGVVH